MTLRLTPAFIVNKIRRRLLAAKLPPPTSHEKELIRQLRGKIGCLSALRPTRAMAESERIWMDFRLELRSALLSKDPRTFLEFSVIGQTMFVDHPRYIRYEYDYLRNRADWMIRWRSAVEESDRVTVPRYPYDRSTSGNLIHYAFHLAQFEEATGIDLSRARSVLEFGGGYGGMCRLLRQLGQSGRYTIFDLPEMVALQEFYLSVHDFDVGPDRTADDSVHCVADFPEPSERGAEEHVDLFIATWSISETSLEFRESFLSRVNARNVLIAYQGSFGEINNAEFFRCWSRARPRRKWREIRCEHMPGRQYYLFGTDSGDLSG
jgi:hypothetical protein